MQQVACDFKTCNLLHCHIVFSNSSSFYLDLLTFFLKVNYIETY